MSQTWAGFTAADVVIGAGLHWGTFMTAVPDRPEPGAYLARLQARPAWQRDFTRNQALYASLHPAG